MSATTILTATRTAWPRLSPRRLLAGLVEADAAYRRTHQLLALDDRLLRDMGVTRADVAAEARRRPW